jgi:hypothetical protein
LLHLLSSHFAVGRNLSMGAERRKHERTGCLIPCEVEIYGKIIEGTVRNISSGGLSLQADVPVSQGDVLNLTLKIDRRKKIRVQGIVWHDRRRRKTGGGAVQRIGLVLSDAPEQFRELLPSSKPAPSKPSPPSAKKNEFVARKMNSSEPEIPPEPPDSPVVSRFRVRVKNNSNPRTRSIVVFAESEDEARESTLSEIGPDWHILELDCA